MADHNLELQAKLEELQRELEVRLLPPSVCLGSTAGPGLAHRKPTSLMVCCVQAN